MNTYILELNFLADIGQNPISLEQVLVHERSSLVIYLEVLEAAGEAGLERTCSRLEWGGSVGGRAGVALELVDGGRRPGLGGARRQQVVHVDVDCARGVGPRGAHFDGSGGRCDRRGWGVVVCRLEQTYRGRR